MSPNAAFRPQIAQFFPAILGHSNLRKSAQSADCNRSVRFKDPDVRRRCRGLLCTGGDVAGRKIGVAAAGCDVRNRPGSVPAAGRLIETRGRIVSTAGRDAESRSTEASLAVLQRKSRWHDVSATDCHTQNCGNRMSVTSYHTADCGIKCFAPGYHTFDSDRYVPRARYHTMKCGNYSRMPIYHTGDSGKHRVTTICNMVSGWREVYIGVYSMVNRGRLMLFAFRDVPASLNNAPCLNWDIGEPRGEKPPLSPNVAGRRRRKRRTVFRSANLLRHACAMSGNIAGCARHV